MFWCVTAATCKFEFRKENVDVLGFCINQRRIEQTYEGRGYNSRSAILLNARK